MNSYTQKDIERYIELRRKLDGHGTTPGLRLDLAFAKKKVDDHKIGDDLNKFLNRPKQHDKDAEAWVKLETRVCKLQKEIKSLENKIIFSSEISESD